MLVKVQCRHSEIGSCPLVAKNTVRLLQSIDDAAALKGAANVSRTLVLLIVVSQTDRFPTLLPNKL